MASYIIILDFEANCSEDEKMKNEIIEFPSVLIKIENNRTERIAEFQLFVKPKYNHKLTSFCTKLTGITQQQVNNGVSFPIALKEHELWLRRNIKNFDEISKTDQLMIWTCGIWDLDVMAPKEYNNHNIQHVHKIYTRFVNIKNEFQKFYKIDKKREMAGMQGMLNYLKIPLQGHHHSGIDDCRNIASIFEKMITTGYNFMSAQQIYSKHI